jgi:hypothetical protein
MLTKKRKEVIDNMVFTDKDIKFLKLWLKIPNYGKRNTCPWGNAVTMNKPCEIICHIVFSDLKDMNSCPCNEVKLYEVMNTIKYALKIKISLWDKFVRMYNYTK